MAEVLNMADKFDPELVKDLFNKARGKSSIAALCKQEPIEFTGNKVFVFSMDNGWPWWARARSAAPAVWTSSP